MTQGPSRPLRLRSGQAPGNFADLPSRPLRSSRVVVIPVPYEGTAEFRGGVNLGPQAILEASQQLEDYDLELGRGLGPAGIYTLPPVRPTAAGPEAMISRVEAVASPIPPRLPVLLGGEHCLTLGMVRALLPSYPSLSVLHIDAHADLREEYEGSRFSHACVMRRVAELCPVASVGVRSLSREEADYISEKGLRAFLAPDYLAREPVAEVMAALTPQVYVTIDLDGLDPSLMPAVTHPVPGGLGWEAILRLLKAVARSRQVVGFDVVELAPREGPQACAVVAATLVYKFLGYILYPGPKG